MRLVRRSFYVILLLAIAAPLVLAAPIETGKIQLWDTVRSATVVGTALKVDGSAVTQPVSGTFTLPAGAATSALQTTGNTSLSSIDGKITAVNTGAVVVSSSALPSGASTAAKQPALGTAGAASSDVISVQGITSMTPLKVDGSGVTLTVASHAVTNAGTFATQAAQSGVWTVQPGNTANTTAWKVDGSAVTQPVSGTFWQATQPVSGTFWQATQPVSAASLPLPSGASTAAKQPALGTAGAASSDVISVQGITSMTPLKVDGSATTQPISVASLPLPSGAATSALQTTANTSLSSIDGKITAVNTGAVVVSSSALPSGAATSANQTTANTSLSSIDGKITAVNTGAVVVSSSALPSGAATSANQTTANTSLSSIDGKITAVNTGAVTISAALPAGTNAIGTVQPGNTQNTTAWLTSNTPATSGGLTTYHLVSAGSTNLTNVKASAAQLYGWYIYNSNASARKLALHNTAGTPTAGASIFFTIMIPGSSAANVFSDTGIAFSSGIGISTVTDLADNGTTAVAANDLIINLFYK